MVTASHNPKDDNGYKVYWENGAQILSPHDTGIAKAILESLEPMETSWEFSEVTSNALCIDPMPQMEEVYMKTQKDLICFSE